MATYKIAVIRGDGIGPEVMNEGLRVLYAVEDCFGINFEFVNTPAGGNAYKKYGDVLPEWSFEAMKECCAIYKAPVGLPDTPKGLIEQKVVIGLRQYFDQYVNLRPIKLLPELASKSPLKESVTKGGIDYFIVRENTEELYSKVGGHKGEVKTGNNELDVLIERLMEITNSHAIDVSINREYAVDRIISYAFNLAKKYNRESVVLVDKANVLFGSQLYRKRFPMIAAKYPEINRDENKSYTFYIDNFSQLLIDPYVSQINVAVMSNIFGDIASDMGIKGAGSLGMGAGANINPDGISMFEPIGGAANEPPNDLTGKNVANPIGMILAGKLMLQTLGEEDAANAIETAVHETIKSGFRTKDIALDGEYVCTT